MSRAARRGDPYRMAHTASGALHFGIDEKTSCAPSRVTAPARSISAAERAALDLAVAAGTVPSAVTDAMFAALRKYWSEDQIVEIVAAIAMAGFVARWNTTMATPLEAEPLAVGEKHLARHGWSPGPHRR